jgi:hypothetical protein
MNSNSNDFDVVNYKNFERYQVSTNIHITHLSCIIQLVSLRAFDRARVWSKLFIIECWEARRLEDLIFATLAKSFDEQNASQNSEIFEISQQH